MRIGRQFKLGCCVVVLALVEPASRASDEIVAGPMALSRLRSLIKRELEPDPTAEEIGILTELHRDACSKYESLAGGGQSQLRQLYDELRFLKKAPDVRRMRDVLTLHKQQVDAVAAIDEALFTDLTSLLASDEPDEASEERVRAGINRVRITRELDRWLQSMPLDEPTGVRGSLREAVAHAAVPEGSREPIIEILHQRDRTLEPLLQEVWEAHRAFVLAGARAFERVFGGVLPPVGALFSDDERERLYDDMKRLCLPEGQRFLAARARVRATDDDAFQKIAELLPPSERVEFALRTRCWFDQVGATMREALWNEARIRIALDALAVDDSDRTAMVEFARAWRARWLRLVSERQTAADADLDQHFWRPSIFGRLLIEDPALWAPIDGRTPQEQALCERVRTRVGQSAFDGAETMSASWWTRSVAIPTRLRDRAGARISESQFYGGSQEWSARQRFAVATMLDSAILQSSIERACGADSDAATVSKRAWQQHRARWETEVEARLDRVRLEVANGRSLSMRSPEWEACVQRILVLRDSAFRAAEEIDEQAFVMIQAAVQRGDLGLANPSALCKDTIALERFSRFLERESAAADGGLLSNGVDDVPRWVELVRSAPVSDEHRVLLEQALLRGIGPYARALVALRVAQFNIASATSGAFTNLARPESRAAVQRLTQPHDEMVRATRDLIELLLTATGDERRAFEQQLLRELCPGAFVVDSHVGELKVRAHASATDEAQRDEVNAAIERHDIALEGLFHRMACERLRSRFPYEFWSATATRSGRPTREQLERERAELRAALETTLEEVLGEQVFGRIAPRDAIDQFLDAVPQVQ